MSKKKKRKRQKEKEKPLKVIRAIHLADDFVRELIRLFGSVITLLGMIITILNQSKEIVKWHFRLRLSHCFH